ncbi:MAG: Coenzyme F420 hydrogenase/dehydrogenase, beta subunit C-terminal domain [Candidatus Desantisbacteria bacterium]
MKLNIIGSIVQNELCIGCGVCAGMCPSKALDMQFNENGLYSPIEKPGCLLNCNLCLAVCPFFEQEKNEDTIGKNIFGNIIGINHRKETGYFMECFVGYSNINNHRQNGASGGLATWLMETMIKKNVVDYVVCVTPNNDPQKLFRFAIFDDVKSICHSSGSVYYPVEMSEVIQKILQTEKRYVVTALPCFSKALRLAMQKSKTLQNRIVAIIGLTCGQIKSKHYTQYLASQAGVMGNLKKVNFRGKDLSLAANNFYFEATNQADETNRLYRNGSFSQSWINRWFTPNACNFCDDVFAEVADATFMDAWLPEYVQESRGTSLVLVRSPMVYDLFKQGISENTLSVKQIAVSKVIISQQSVIDIKTRQLSYRLYLDRECKKKILDKRVVASNTLDFFAKKKVSLENKMQKKSKKIFLSYKNNNAIDWQGFIKEMSNDLRELEKYQKIERVLTLPFRVLRKLKRSLRSCKL